MAVELTPKGTRGVVMPRLPRPVMKALYGLIIGLFRVLRGRLRIMGMPLLLLTTVGARSGRPHTTPLAWFPDGDDAWLVTATAGGSARHPAWYFNMARNPGAVWIEIGTRRLQVRPESLKEGDREAAWRRIVAQAPQFGPYGEKTDRVIPVIRLRPAEPH
jgi:deazaflavin-dependent oxidoreductase (nitroreductase family)